MDQTTKAPSIGIDLGTSNSAVFLSDVDRDVPASVGIFQQSEFAQWIEGEILPSVIYLAPDEESLDGKKFPDARFPKDLAAKHCGVWARSRASQVPDRCIVSAKSWLCHPGVDRRAAILPWGSENTRYSPVDASRWILEHLRWSIERKHDFPISDALTVLTVPASFDEVARRLTAEAAQSAGFKNLRLLEEPQAAFYGWIAEHAESWRKDLQRGDLVLVVDVGGGTTDFSLISIQDRSGDLELERVAVGEHLLLGGDNMDLSLAAKLAVRLELEHSIRLDPAQWISLTQAAREAKERLLSDGTLDRQTVSIVGRGSSLFGSAMSTELTREEVQQTLVEGFFPCVAASDFPAVARKAGLREIGLPYTDEPAITRHLGKFLAAAASSIESIDGDRVFENGGRRFARPTAVLFNGGVFKSGILRDRVLEVLNGWCGPDSALQATPGRPDSASRTMPGRPVRELRTEDYELAVARGASFYAKTIGEGKGLRIKASTARSYYLGVEPSRPAIPGLPVRIGGLCVVPQGLEEGTRLELAGRPFGLLTGETVDFRFFSSSSRPADQFGDTVEDAERELEETARLSVTLPRPEGDETSVVAVQLEAQVTELGTLALVLHHTSSDQKWDLEFNVRPNEDAGVGT